MGSVTSVASDWPPDVSDDLPRVLRDVCAVAAPPGHEDRLSALLSFHLGMRGMNPVTDRLGQVLTVFGTGERKRILVTAHMDQVGLVITGIDDNGYLRIQRIGGIPERVLPGTPMVVLSEGGDIPAIVGLKSHHLTPPEDKYRAVPVQQLYLDVGARNRAHAEKIGVRPGDPCVYASTWGTLSEDRIRGTALDDRLGVTALLALADQLAGTSLAGQVAIAFSALEEFNVRGTLALTKRYRPDIVVNLDIVPATDTPDLTGVSDVRLGGGPVLSRLSFHGRGTLGGLIPHPALVAGVQQAAASCGTGLQYAATVGLITDAAFLPMGSAEGVAAVEIAIPIRYTHSPIEMCQLSDLSQTIALLSQVVRTASEYDLDRGTHRASH